MPGTAQILQTCKKTRSTRQLPSCHRSNSWNNDLLDAVRTWILVRLDLDADPLYTVKIQPPNQTIPSWSATNSVCSPDEISRKRIAFLPILPYPVTQYDIVYTAMKNLQGVLCNIDQLVLPVTCDGRIYDIAREIQRIRTDEFSNIILVEMYSWHLHISPHPLSNWHDLE